jgi:predicted enzyme related to lactoylglutathione lyase
VVEEPEEVMKKKIRDRLIDYIELPAKSTAKSKAFYSIVFGWTYKDWGPDYADTKDSGVTSGLNGGKNHRPKSPLVVFYADDLEAARARVKKAGGKVTRDIFAFPGGRRFHFTDPAGSELAVWSEK